METFLIIDGDNIVHRSFHAIPVIQSDDPNEIPNNALRGFANSVLNLKAQVRATRIIAAFDGGTPPFRREAIPSYKGNRGERLPELDIQLKLCQKLLCPALGIASLKTKEVEADDILYTLALEISKLPKENICWIASGDKDIAQCLQLPRTYLLRPPKQSGDPWVQLDKIKAHELFGVHPHQIADYLALTGDSVDNLPGITGVGPKTAAKWLEEYKDIETILANKENIKPPRFIPLLDKELLEKNRIVTTSYHTGHQIPAQLEYNQDNAIEMLNELKLFKIANRIAGTRKS
jgi:DNA polymerase-1